MVKHLSRVGLLGLLFATLAAGFGTASLEASARGAGVSYTATLSGGEEVPPRATPGAGEVSIQVSPDGQSLTYTVTVRDLTNVTMGHIHLGSKGANGDIVLPLVPTAPPAGGPRSGIIGQGTATAAQLVGPLQGRPLMDLVNALDGGSAYVNIHTSAGGTPATLQPGDLPPGEIRGQLILAPTPTTLPRTGAGFGSRIARPWAMVAVLFAVCCAWKFRRRLAGGTDGGPRE